MKSFYITLCFLLLVCIGAAAQVYTCKGEFVSASVLSEFTPTEISYYNNATNATYSYLGMTFLDNSSNQYNCHAYAWHLREGNSNRVWINNAYENDSDPNNCYPQLYNIDTYWNDGCFIQVCNEADADKVHYYCGDHSAVKSTTHPGYYESKWGAMPLYRHTLLGVPYNQPSSHNYYASTQITGDLYTVCAYSRTFSVKNISGATYSWTYSSNVTPVGGTNGYQFTIQRNGSSTGTGWVEVSITTSCSGIAATRRVEFPVGAAPQSPSGIQPGPMTPIDVELYVYPVPGATSYKWYKNGVLVSGQTGTTVDIPVTCGVNTQIGVEAVNACGASTRIYRTVKAPCWGGGGVFMVSPNPATGIISVSHKTDNAVKVAAGTSTFNEIRIYNMQGELKKYVRYNKAKQASLSVHDLSNGIYFIEISTGSYKEKQQLSIQH
jgi:hypothetical protein